MFAVSLGRWLHGQYSNQSSIKSVTFRHWSLRSKMLLCQLLSSHCSPQQMPWGYSPLLGSQWEAGSALNFPLHCYPSAAEVELGKKHKPV